MSSNQPSGMSPSNTGNIISLSYCCSVKSAHGVRPHVHFGKRENLGKLSMTNSFALPNVKMFGMPKFYELFGESK